MLKTASREQHRHAGPEGLWCPVCNPKVYSTMRKQTAQNRAALEEIRDGYPQPLRPSPMVGETRE